jgi:hypothetical protein
LIISVVDPDPDLEQFFKDTGHFNAALLCYYYLSPFFIPFELSETPPLLSTFDFFSFSLFD